MKQFLISIISLLILSCSSSVNEQWEGKYEIIDYKMNNQKIAMYTIAASDTNWMAMEKMGKELLKDKSQHSAVGFFFPKDKVPTINDNLSLNPTGSGKYMIAVYRYEKTEAKFELVTSGDKYRELLKKED